MLGQPQVSEPLYVMERETAAPKAAVDEGLGFAVRNDLPSGPAAPVLSRLRYAGDGQR